MLWLEHSYFSQKQEFYLVNSIHFLLIDSSGVDYCDVCISCLDSHSDGTHSLQWIHW